MSTKYKFNDQDQLYFVSFAVVNWIDLFIRNEYKDIMIASWKHCQQYKGLEIWLLYNDQSYPHDHWHPWREPGKYYARHEETYFHYIKGSY